MQMAFVPYDRNKSAPHVLFFYSGRFQSATHIAFFYAGNMPYASRLGMFFVLGLENPARLRFIFGRGMGNRVGIGLRFVRGMDFGVGIRFIRPLAWPPVGRMLLRPTRIIKNRPGIGFVFRGGAEKGAGRGLCEKWGRRTSIIIRRLLPLRARRRMGPIIASAHAFIIPNYVA